MVPALTGLVPTGHGIYCVLETSLQLTHRTSSAGVLGARGRRQKASAATTEPPHHPVLPSIAAAIHRRCRPSVLPYIGAAIHWCCCPLALPSIGAATIRAPAIGVPYIGAAAIGAAKGSAALCGVWGLSLPPGTAAARGTPQPVTSHGGTRPAEPGGGGGQKDRGITGVKQELPGSCGGLGCAGARLSWIWGVYFSKAVSAFSPAS